MAEGGALRDLLARFSVDVDTKSLTAFEHGVSGVFERIQKYASIFAGMFALNALREFVSETIESAAELKKLSGRLQVDTDEFQKIQKFLRASTEETAMAIQRLNRGIGSAKGGEKSPIEKLGISLKDAKGELKPTSELVLEMADRVSAMKTPAEKTAAVLDVFGRSAGGMIKPLSLGRKEAEKFFKEFEELGGVVGKDFIEQSVHAEHEMKKFKVVMGGLKREAVAALLPTVLKLAEGLKHLALKAKGLLGGTQAIEHFVKMAKFAAVVAGIYKTIAALRMLSIATLTNPFILLIFGVVALALVVEDLWVLLEGGDSLIGDALGPDKAEFVNNLTTAFNDMRGALAGIGPWLESLGIDLKGIFFENLIIGLRNTFEGVTVLIDGLKLLVGMIENIKKINLADISSVQGLTNAMRSILPTESILKAGERGKSLGNVVGGGQTVTVPKQDNSVKVENKNNINVTVQTAGSSDTPPEAGKIVGTGIRKELDKMNVDAINAGKKK